MNKKFYEYSNASRYPTVNEVVSPHCPTGEDDPVTFLAYAEGRKAAFYLAMAHIYDGKPLQRFYGEYNGENYHGEVSCVM
ncbi:hypothetical protein SAMN05443270_3079 [Lacrimispora sphenoides]|jgi:hypothetical protein|uniref:hypothetical protein n=1 Tax=Lacrimispora sphenoides TaxID=29370 RepID=UPI00044B34B7|nr:hypothetical protein [Lacrimispora sphenoides]EXG86546.1 hypothetical protein K413DRAFT_3385 [Clostridium sp. ASBs410]SEU09286.1 hypothetical protein SAMN05443270_3079 [Lacrimispora sphenoides]